MRRGLLPRREAGAAIGALEGAIDLLHDRQHVAVPVARDVLLAPGARRLLGLGHRGPPAARACGPGAALGLGRLLGGLAHTPEAPAVAGLAGDRGARRARALELLAVRQLVADGRLTLGEQHL